MAMKSFKKIIMTAVALSLSAFLVMPVQAADNAAADEQIMVRGGEDYIDGFDPVFYANKYPDVYAAFGNDAAMLYQHYLLCGKAEGRWPNAAGPAGTSTTAAASSDYIDGFDPVFYANKYPDVKAAFGTDAALLYQHYLLCGKAEGRWPNAAGPAGTSTTVVVQPTGLLTTAGTYLPEEYVYNKIMGRKNVPGYTEGTYYTNGTRYYNTVSCEGYGPGHFLGMGCYGYMMDMLEYATDYQCPIVKVPASWNNLPALHVGDSPRTNNDQHTVVITEVHADGHTVTVTEANFNSSVHWGRVIDLADPSTGLVYIDTIWAR